LLEPIDSMRLFLSAAIPLSLALIWASASSAQMALPGAVAPTPAGQAVAPPKVAPAAKKRPSDGAVETDRHFAPAKPPGVEAVVGKTFGLSGSRGALALEKTGSDLQASRLTLVGDKISQPNQACEVSMGGDGPVKLKPLGAPDGLWRFELDSTACPLQFDVLSGALRATSPAGACTFAQADCRVDGAGLWGPPGSSFSDADAKALEKERATLEKSLRAHFRGLLARLKKDKPATQAAVKEQAAANSQRAQVCRDYDRDDAQGFCALRLTEARDLQLQARLAAANGKGGDKKAEKTADRKNAPPAKAPRPVAPAKPSSGGAPAAGAPPQ
jgi:hypothetical protein